MGDVGYDSFSNFERIEIQPFTFKPARFEIWENGEKTAHGQTSCVVKCSKSQTEAGPGAKVELKNLDRKSDEKVSKEISKENYFDVFVTAGDRLMLVKVPSKGKGNEHEALSMFKITVGTTREYFEFGRKDPYCTNLFLKNNVIKKITFSFSNPEMLIEFYESKHEEKDISDSSYDALKQEAERIKDAKNR